MTPEILTNSFLLSNLHCTSCVSYIQNILFQLVPPPISVSSSLLSSWVTVRYPKSLALQIIYDAIEDAGFHICHINYNSQDFEFNSHVEKIILKPRENTYFSNSRSNLYFSRHIKYCKKCQFKVPAKKLESNSDLMNSCLDKKRKALIENSDQVNNLLTARITVDPTGQRLENLWRAFLSVGGMTCTTCATTIKKRLETKSWVKKVTVSLITNSVTVEFFDEHNKKQVINAIKDAGFEAVIDIIEKISTVEVPHNLQLRTVEILIEKNPSIYCPSRIIDSLRTVDGISKVDENTRDKKSSLIIAYSPHPPDFTIREILANIVAVDPTTSPSLYHPSTPEDSFRKIHAREKSRMLIRALFTMIFAFPTFIIGIVYMSLVPKENRVHVILMKPVRVGISKIQWILFALATPVYFFGADVFHKRAFKEIRDMWRPNSTIPIFQRFYRFGSMNMLISLGTSIAYISSLSQLISAGLNKNFVADNNLFYFDSVVFLTLFLLVGRLLELYSKAKTGNAIALLAKLKPAEAHLVEPISITVHSQESSGNQANGKDVVRTLKTICVDLLEIGDLVKVLYGESPPCDGVIVNGDTILDESNLTGESRLIKKRVKDEVFSGTLNKASPFIMRITSTTGTSMLDQIVKAVREGQTRRAPIERIADRLTSFFVPLITLIAILTCLLWFAIARSNTLTTDFFDSGLGSQISWSLQFAIAVVVIACPCGLALAAPTALFVGSGMAAKNGILAKGGGEAFEKAARLKHVVFDKTGTLTLGGEPRVTDYRIFVDDESEKKYVLSLIKAVEFNSNHIIAKAIMAFCSKHDLEEIQINQPRESAGKGMIATIDITSMDYEKIIIGNEALLNDYEVEINGSAHTLIEKWKSQGKSIALTALKVIAKESSNIKYDKTNKWKLVAVFGISDPIRPEAPIVLKVLKEHGIGVWMLSGDNQTTANAVGSQVGIPVENIIAGVLPGQKAEKIDYLKRSLKIRSKYLGCRDECAVIAMVGDGINDSPALTTADVGIAIGSGSDIAISSAEFVLVTSNLHSLITLLELSRFVFLRIKLNFGWALIYNLIALPIAAGALYPVTRNGIHLRLDPIWASLAMAASSISVVCSSLLMRSRVPIFGFRPSHNHRNKMGKDSC